MMTREQVRARLTGVDATPSPVSMHGRRPPARAGDAPDQDDQDRRLLPAAVLVGLVGYSAGPSIILTQRTPHLRDHAGQISFPGGRIEPTDEDPEAAALRETAEETGVAPERVQILGRLRPYDTITGFRVQPIVGWIEPPVTYVPDPVEVSEVFEVPLSFVLDTANHRQAEFEAHGRSGTYYFLDYEDRHIWGATAGMLVNFARILNG